MARISVISVSAAVLSLSTCAMALGVMVKRDPIGVLEDFKTLAPLVKGLITATNAFPAEGGTLVEFAVRRTWALRHVVNMVHYLRNGQYVHQNVTAVTGQINQTTTDIQVTPLYLSKPFVLNLHSL